MPKKTEKKETEAKQPRKKAKAEAAPEVVIEAEVVSGKGAPVAASPVTVEAAKADEILEPAEWITALPVRVHRSFLDKVDQLVIDLKKVRWEPDSNRGITRSSVLRSILRAGLKKIQKTAVKMSGEPTPEE